jgi:succinate dehydrogenase/fumarate reductase flavoprotein subunit
MGRRPTGSFDLQRTRTELLIIGSGAAGFMAAIRAAQEGCRVLLADKQLIGRGGCTVMAEQLAAVVPSQIPGDSPEQHYRDTLEAGRGLCRPELVRILAEEVFERVRELEALGLRLDKRADGTYVLDQVNGHRYPRSLYNRDVTGRSVIRALRGAARDLGVVGRADLFVAALLEGEDGLAGALAVDARSGNPVMIQSKAVLLATGGAAGLFSPNTNPAGSTGDGLVLALQAGALLEDLEFVQFYPVCLSQPASVRGGVLGISQYGRLLNDRNERFMGHYYPEALEGTTRDRLSQAIAMEIRAGRGTRSGGVYCDLTGMDQSLYDQYSSLIRFLRRRGIDIETRPVEVCPAAHYTMGGVRTDEKGKTTVDRLFAAGEITSGVHGANRLGNNSLSETLVFGFRAGRSAARCCRKRGFSRPSSGQLAGELERIAAPIRRKPKELTPAVVKKRLQLLMSECAGVLRDEPRLARAGRELQQLQEQLRLEVGIRPEHLVANRQFYDYFETENMLLLSRGIIGAARLRRESRGAQFRLDYPNQDDLRWLTHISVTGRGGTLEVENDPGSRERQGA